MSNTTIAAAYERQARILTALSKIAWRRCNIHASNSVSAALLQALRAEEAALVTEMSATVAELAALAAATRHIK